MKQPVLPSREIIFAMNREFAERRSKNPSYSLRGFARFLGLQPAAVSQILNGKRGVTRKSGQKIITKLSSLSERAPELLAGLKGKNSRSSSDNLLQEKPFSELDAQAFRAIADWHYYALLSLAETDDFESDPKWISSRLGLKLSVAKKTIHTLLDLGMLKRDESGKLSVTGKQFSSTHDIVNIALQRAHVQGLELATNALAKVPVEGRDFSYMVMAADAERLPEAKKMIRDFRRKLCALLEGGPKKTEVFRLSVQLFPLTHKKEKKS